MRSQSTARAARCLCLGAGLAACSAGGFTTEHSRALHMSAMSSGKLWSCDDRGECRALPNPADCAAYDAVVDTQSGRVCETCVSAAGAAIFDRCSGTNISCAVVTAPEPDCVVCAYIDGSVVFSSCIARPPASCRTFSTYPACNVCYDDAGREVLRECPTACENVICPSTLVCAPGYSESLLPGQCCPTCVPRLDCEEVVCATTLALPECPQGTTAVRDPADCCSYVCQATQCQQTVIPDAANPDGAYPLIGCANNRDCPLSMVCFNAMCTYESTDQCPKGYVWDITFPACGMCAPLESARYCRGDWECNGNELCTNATDCLVSPACLASGGACVDVCYGVCRPLGLTCPDYGLPSTPCSGGAWQSPAFDAAGCPLPPVCVCADGSVALDQVCTGACDQLACGAEPTCDPGAHIDHGYPYCCGVCIPDAPACTTSADCTDQEQCSTVRGDCSTPWVCDNSSQVCTTVCYGVCEPKP